MKVYEFAKDIGLETITLMDKIRKWGLPVKSHMAALDDDMISEIKSRLAAESAATKPAAKVTKKKVAKKAAAAPRKVATKPTTARSAAQASEAASAPSSKKVVRKQTVIRRKASEEAEAEEAAAAAALAAQQALAEQEIAQEEPGVAPQEDVVATAVVEASPDAEAQAAPAVKVEPEAPKRPRGRIVGRMDLARVTPPPSPQGGYNRDQAMRNRATGPRNIRTGFVAPPPMVAPDVVDTSRDIERRRIAPAVAPLDDKKQQPKRPGTGTETEQQKFTATEFRKREVIFQPKKKRANLRGDVKKTQITTPKASKRVVKIFETIKVGDLAQQMGVKAPLLVRKLMQEGVMATMNTDLDFDTVALLVPEFGFEAEAAHRSEDELVQAAAFGSLEAERTLRPPVVTVMGHVDHGKTTLLDAIRKADVAKGEAGGITQHIGAYRVKLEDGKVATFIDTPGHEAFTAMRARGANVTDVAIIVVAADDGVMPQTVEAISHAKAAGVPIIVAVNKMDRPNANPDRIKQQLTEYEVVAEEWGGTTIFVPVSALKKEGIHELLEQIHLVAEVAELEANPGRSATGIVIESRLEKGRGNVATVLVRDGTLKVGDVIAAGLVMGRVRSLINDKGEVVKEAGPGVPVEVMGLPETPDAGDRFDAAKDEAAALAIVDFRRKGKEAEKVQAATADNSLEAIFSKIKAGDVKELSLVLKSDVAGSNEAIKGMLDKLQTDEVKVKIIHSAVGGISESDVLLASTAKGLVLGFNVRPDVQAARMAKERGVDIRSYSIIYNLVDDMKKAMSGLLKPEVVEVAAGRAEVRNTFSVPKIGMIAGCAVIDGKINRSNLLRLVRDGRVIYEGKVSSLKRFKDDVREVASGYECGIGIENFNDIKVGDVIEAFSREEVAREL